MAESNNIKSNKITLKIFIPEDPSVQATLSPVDGEKNKLDCLAPAKQRGTSWRSPTRQSSMSTSMTSASRRKCTVRMR